MMNPTQDMDDIKIIFACGECTFATTERSELDSHLATVHEISGKPELLQYDHSTDTTIIPSAQQTTLQYVTPGNILLAPINSQVKYVLYEFYK